MRAVVGGLLVGVWLVSAPVWATTEGDLGTPAPVAGPTVRYRDDKLSVDAHDVGLGALLKAIARESGAELVGAPRTERPVTVSFENIPLKEALERLVGAQNFTLKYQDGGALKAIELRGGQKAAEKAKAEPEKPTSQGNTTPPKGYAFYKAFNRSDPVPGFGDPKKALGHDEPRSEL